MADLSELQGEVLALTCALAALLSTAPIASQNSMWRRFDELSGLVFDRLDEAGKSAFSQTVVRMSAKRQRHEWNHVATPPSCPQSS